MDLVIIFILTGAMLFSYWLAYIMGGPMSDDPKHVNPRAILFSFPEWLAKRRLTTFDLFDLYKQFGEEINLLHDYVEKVKANYEYKKDVFLKGRELFTWEKTLLCPICFHFWLSVLLGAILIISGRVDTWDDFGFGFLLYLVNHLIIRKIS